MNLKAGKFLSLLFIFVGFSFVFAEEPQFFQAEVNADKINIRSDSTVSSPVICQVDKGDILEVVLERYGWFKVRLPKNVSVFIKKNMVSITQNNNAKVMKDRVNIRLNPNEASPILGKSGSGEAIAVLGETKDWYRIEPTLNCFGWINKKFISKIQKPPLAEITQAIPDKPKDSETYITIVGVIQPCGMIIKRLATHKIVTKDRAIYLLKADKQMLNQYNRKKVMVSGKLFLVLKQDYQIIEVEKVELIN